MPSEIINGVMCRFLKCSRSSIPYPRVMICKTHELFFLQELCHNPSTLKVKCKMKFLSTDEQSSWYGGMKSNFAFLLPYHIGLELFLKTTHLYCMSFHEFSFSFVENFSFLNPYWCFSVASLERCDGCKCTRRFLRKANCTRRFLLPQPTRVLLSVFFGSVVSLHS